MDNERTIRKLQADRGQGVSIGGVSFRSLVEWRAWYKQQVLCDEAIICFMDFHAAINYGLSVGDTTSDFIDYQAKVRKAGFSDINSAKVLSSFELEVTSPFGSV